MPWYYRAKTAINAAVPFLVPTQKTNLALLVSAILKKRTLCLSEPARAYPTPKKRGSESFAFAAGGALRALPRALPRGRPRELFVNVALC